MTARSLPAVLLALAASALAACSSAGPETARCTPATLPTLEPGVLTIATGRPAYAPWVLADRPESGEGFEAAVAYAVADKLGFGSPAVKWARSEFSAAISAGAKPYDFNLQQYSITEERARLVDFSPPYYRATQAIVALQGGRIARVTSLQGLRDTQAILGAAAGTTSFDSVGRLVGLTPRGFPDTEAAVVALRSQQLDGIVVDLPTAFYLAAAEIPGSIIVGQIAGSDATDGGFGLLLSKDSALTLCVSRAVAKLRDEGVLEALAQRWLASSAGAPVLR